MKVHIKKIHAPKLATNAEIEQFSEKLTDTGSISDCRSAITACTALTLAIAPDDERSSGTLLFYLENLISPSGITHTTIEAVGLWLAGLPLDSDGDLTKEQIYSNFRGAYLFSWQKRLLKLAVDSYNELCSHEHPSELCEIAYHRALGYFNESKNSSLCDII